MKTRKLIKHGAGPDWVLDRWTVPAGDTIVTRWNLVRPWNWSPSACVILSGVYECEWFRGGRSMNTPRRYGPGQAIPRHSWNGVVGEVEMHIRPGTHQPMEMLCLHNPHDRFWLAEVTGSDQPGEDELVLTSEAKLGEDLPVPKDGWAYTIYESEIKWQEVLKDYQERARKLGLPTE